MGVRKNGIFLTPGIIIMANCTLYGKLKTFSSQLTRKEKSGAFRWAAFPSLQPP